MELNNNKYIGLEGLSKIRRECLSNFRTETGYIKEFKKWNKWKKWKKKGKGKGSFSKQKNKNKEWEIGN